MLADISQSTDRGRVCLTGMIPTITTSSFLYNFGRAVFVSPRDLLTMHGLNVKQLRLPSFADSEVRVLAGNMMCTSTQVVALTPVLEALGILTKIQ